MRLPFIAAAALAALALGAGEKVRITDSSGGGCDTLGRFAMPWAARKGLELSVRKLDVETALERLVAGDTDMVLLKQDALPSDFAGKRRICAYRALVAAVNVRNPVRSITRSQLKKLLTESRPTWAEVGGDAVDIHRYGVKGENGKLLGEKELNLFAAADEMLLLETFGEALTLADVDPAALTLGPYEPELPEHVTALAIDGAAPTRRNIRSGAYPLREAYWVVIGPTPLPAAEELFGLLGTKEFYAMLEADGLIPPAVPSEKRKE